MELPPGNSRREDLPVSLVPGLSTHRSTLAPAVVYADMTEEATGPSIEIGGLLKRYWLLLLAFLIFGAAAGFASVIFSAPKYKAHVILVVESASEAMLQGASSASFEANEVNVQTQISILRGGPFLKRGAERMQSETVPLAPTGQDLFSKLRQRLRPASQDPLENARQGLGVAMNTFNAQPVSHTRLIELTCESTSPDVASQFLNAMAAEFAEDSSQSQMRRSQKTSEFLGAQTEETKARLQDAEERLRDFVQASGNLFAGQDVTLDDTKLAQLKSELAKIESDRIAKQTRFELTKKYTPDALGEVLDDGGLKQYQQQIGTLKREKAALETTLTPKNEKVVRLDAQLKVVEKQYENEVAAVVTRLRTDYEAALRHETLLNGAYASQSQRVGAQAGKAAQYNALKREVDTLRQMYQAILMQSNQNGLSNSVPMSPIRVVEASFPPEAPYSPVPVLNISIGTMFGLVFAGGLVFLRERMDSSIKSTGTARRLINVPELGIIPGLGEPKKYARTLTKYLGRKHPRALEGHGSSSLDAWNEAPSLVAESFRGALASIIRNETHGRPQRVILVTSPGMGEGKSTVVENLGIALAESGRKVLLVDGDFRRPVLHERFNLPNDRALIDLVKEGSAFAEANFESFCVSSSIPGLSVLPNRVTGANVSSMLYSPRLRTILRNLWDKYEMVLVDAPPILAVADARILAPMMDAVILVLRYGVTSQEGAREAHQRIQEDRIPLLGTILTDWNASKKNNYYYGYSNDKG